MKKKIDYDNLKDELLSVLDSGLKSARKKDREAEFEFYIFYRHCTRVDVKQGVVEATDGLVEGNAVRIAKRKSVGFASSSGISTERIEHSLDEAIASLKAVSVKDERFRGFCEPLKPGSEGAFSSEILSLSKDKLIKYADGLVKEAKGFDPRVLYATCSCSADWGGFAVGNTLGLQQASRSASNTCQVYCVAAKNEERRTGNEYDISRERVIKSEGLGESAAQQAVALLNAKKLGKTGVLPTVWIPIVASSYLFASLGQSASGRAVVEGLSPLSDRLGKKIAHSNLTVVDDGQEPTSLSTEAVDAEGYPQKRKPLIEKGVLKNFMFDTYYGRIYGAESTGNCSRKGGIFGSTPPYESQLSIQPCYIKVTPGKRNIENMMKSIDGQAILIADVPIGIFHSNVATGEFSAVAQSVFLIEKGEKKHPLQPVTVAGNFYKGLHQLIDIGNDSQKTPFSVETPTLIFDGFSVVG
ncbi:MAG: TldD/PmbA family protein [Candidatus Bathyarchaeia archaeon]|jgi:PmbA protein